MFKEIISIMSFVLILAVVYASDYTPNQMFLILSASTTILMLLGVYGEANNIAIFIAAKIIYATVFISPTIIVVLGAIEFIHALYRLDNRSSLTANENI